MLVIALKDDHVSALSAVYRGARDLGADFLLGGSGHNAGVINPPAANKHGYWTRPDQPEQVEQWLAGATRHEGSWWPWWTDWLTARGANKQVSARTVTDSIEPAPGRYATAP
jgi:polyhydroxyalkanoate synthase